MFIEQKILPDVDFCRAATPVSAELAARKVAFDEMLRNNFLLRERLTVVCGPCSADDYNAMVEYLTELKKISDDCPNLLVVARIYTTKPHSDGQGYKGACFHLHNSDTADLTEGILRCRRMMIKCLEMGLPVADELLYLELYEYFADLVSYWFIGARSSEDSLHRAFASGLDVCCGLKNGTDGDISKAVESLYAVSRPSVFPYSGKQVATDGCSYAHIVLRGGKARDKFTSNINNESIEFAVNLLKKRGLSTFIMADLSHANSGKVAQNQIANAKLIASNSNVSGVMIESYLYGGKESDVYGISQTDDCLSIEDTAKLIRYLQNVRGNA